MASLPPENAAYFAALCERVGGRVEVVPFPGKGKGLIAKQKIKEGEWLYLEQPLGTLQHASNLALVCEHCKRFVGTLEQQLDLLVTVRLNAAQKAQLPAEEAAALNASYRTDFPRLPPGFHLPAIDDTAVAPVLPCSQACGDVYCSATCRDAAWRKYHGMLCPGPADDEGDDEEQGGASSSSSAAGAGAGATKGKHALRHRDSGCEHDHDDGEAAADDDDEGGDDDDEDDGGHGQAAVNAAALFKQQAMATNEIFCLAGRMYCRILEAWIKNGNDMIKALMPFTVLHTEPWSALFAKQQEGVAAREAAEEEVEEDEEDEEEEEEEPKPRKKGLFGAGAGSGAHAKAQQQKHQHHHHHEDDDHSDDGDSDDDHSSTYVARTQAQIQEWCRDSVSILRILINERLPAFVELVESEATKAQVGKHHHHHHHHDHSEGCGCDASAPAADASTATPVPAPSSSSRPASRRSLQPHEQDMIFDPAFYEVLIGSFELNNIEMKIDSPLRDYFLAVVQGLPRCSTASSSSSKKAGKGKGSKPKPAPADAAPPAPGSFEEAMVVLSPVLRQVVKAWHARRELGATVRAMVGDDDDEDAADAAAEIEYEEGDEEGEDAIVVPADKYGPEIRVSPLMFPVCSGTALFSVQCCANHSCEPNVQLEYSSGDCTGSLVAKRDLLPGEELCINYIDIEQPVAFRQADLKHYGFQCGCEKCVAEMAASKA